MKLNTEMISVQHNRKGFSPLILLVVVGAVLVGVGGFFAFNLINKPAQIKEKAVLVKASFTAYDQTMNKIVDDLKTEGKSDSDSLERNAQKSEGLIKEAEKERIALDGLVSTMSISEMDQYKNSIKDYLAKADLLMNLETQSQKLSEGYVQPTRDYEKLTVSLGGASTYLYNDPDKYIQIVRSGIADEQRIIDALKRLSLTGDLAAYNDEYVKNLEIEKTFLEKIAAAVEKRKATDISSATQQFTLDMQEGSRAMLRISDKLEQKVKDISSDFGVAQKQVESNYTSLSSKYNF